MDWTQPEENVDWLPPGARFDNEGIEAGRLSHPSGISS